MAFLLLQAEFGTLNWCILSVYLCVMVVIGLRFAGKQKTTEDYFLAGRRMPWLVVGMSMFASLTSAISYMGLPAMAYKENISQVTSGIASLVVAPILIFVFYPFYRLLKVTTSYEYVLKRYGSAARTTVSSLFVLARLGWLGTVIYAPALALSVVTDLPLWLAIALMGVLATSYTALGGLAAVLWTDVIQFVTLVVGAIWVAVSLTTAVPGGYSEILEIAGPEKLDVFEFRFSLFEMSAIAAGLSYVCELLQNYGTDQVTVQRLIAVRTGGGMARAIIFNALADLIMMSLLLYLGLGLFAYYTLHPSAVADGLKADSMLPYYIVHALPNGISGLLITAIFAAAMSSMDSGINSLSTVLVKDFIQPLRRSLKSEHHDVNLARVLTVLLGVLATVVAFYASTVERILESSSFFLGLFAGPILAIFLLGMISRRANFIGWLGGVGLAVPTLIWIHFRTEIHFIHYFPLGFGICAITGFALSLLLSVLGYPLADEKFTIWGRQELQNEGTKSSS